MVATIKPIGTPLTDAQYDIYDCLAKARHFRETHDLTEAADIRMLAAEQKYINSILEWWQKVFWEDISRLFGCQLGHKQLDLMDIEIGELVLAAAYKRFTARLSNALK